MDQLNEPKIRLFSRGDNYNLYHGNMLEMLEVIEPDSIDSIVTDPPYELGFMSKSWDKSGIAFQPDTWEKCYKVLKPGGYLLAFGGSRTYHRIACAIEDAGFEIRDTIMWLYGSGFPKSMNISKQIDKKPKADMVIEFKAWLKDQLDTCGKTYTQINEECGFTATSYSKTDYKDGWSTNLPNQDKWLKMKEVIGIDTEEYDWVCEDNTEERGYIEPTGGLASGSGNTVGCFTGKQLSDNAVDENAKKWQGWGTALKPAYEPVIVARKPFLGSCVENVLRYGVGGINIDECRVPCEDLEQLQKNWTDRTAPAGFNGDRTGIYGSGRYDEFDDYTPSGRFPSNVILTYDDTDIQEVCGGMPDTDGGTYNKQCRVRRGFMLSSEHLQEANAPDQYGDNGNASRYFYCAKASKRDRDEGLEGFKIQRTGDLQGGRKEGSAGSIMKNANGGTRVNPYAGTGAPKKNTHPTVKPTDLMQYLIRLVTPKGGIILDPFNGSGSTGKAVMWENRDRNADYKYIGIELTEEYLPIADARIKYAMTANFVKEDAVKQKVADKQLNLFELPQ